MELSSWIIYFIMMIDSIKIGIGEFGDSIQLLGLLAFIGFGVLVLFTFAEDLGKKFRDQRKRFMLITYIGLSFVLVGACITSMRHFVPSRKALCAMYAVPKIVNSDKLQETLSIVSSDSKEIYKLGVEALKEKLK